MAAISYVLAKHYTSLNPDEALLTGLLHVIGRLYIVMRFEETEHVSDEELGGVVAECPAEIGKAISESGGLSDALTEALEHQKEYTQSFKGPARLTEVLIAAKIINHGGQDPAAQTHFILDKIQGAVESLGGKLEDVERTRSCVSERSQGEQVARGTNPGETGSSLLDLCMRCGNCEEVC